jgi:hypothetical protein
LEHNHNASEGIHGMNKMGNNGVLVLAAIVLIGSSVATGLIVHHNDTISADRNMMMSDTMQQKALSKAAEMAAMQQAEKDKMASQDTMMPNDNKSMAN